MQEDKVVTEEVHRVGDPGQGHRHPHEGVGVRDRGEGGAEGVHTGAEPQELPGDRWGLMMKHNAIKKNRWKAKYVIGAEWPIYEKTILEISYLPLN